MRSRTCGKYGCYGIVKDGRCTHCGRSGDASNWRAATRASAAERGYDATWRAVRAEYIRQQALEAVMAGISAHPICEICNRPILNEIHVDHRIPFKGLDDPKRLDISNLRVLHKSCHMRHTADNSC